MSNNDDTLLDVVLMFNGGPLGPRRGIDSKHWLNQRNIGDLGPVVQSWVKANPGLKLYSILVCAFVNVCSLQNFGKQNSS